ncbi:MAG: DEAD/DEAH box helicase [Opitutales bacterium]|nr:DEAD/DEAH box helicase [Opitutales bacterium]
MFYVPRTQKSYSAASILSWSEILDCRENGNWEEDFVPAAFLKNGRRLYREIPHAYALTLGLWTATIVFRLENIGDVKILLSAEKNTRRLKWQSPADLPFEMRAGLAVAAVYFVEEFLAEESPKLVAKEEKADSAPAEKSVPEKTAVPEGKSLVEEKKTLKLFFKLEETLLILSAQFVFEDEKRSPISALSKLSDAGIVLTSEDRRSLLKLGSFAHKAGFVFNSRNRVYELCEMSKIEIFVRNFLKSWEQAFPDIDGAKKLFGIFNQAATEVDTLAKLSSAHKNSFSLHYLLSYNGKVLSDKESRLLLKNREDGIYLPEYGRIKLRSRDLEFLADWEEKEDKELPIYSLLSLYNGESSKNLIADKKLTRWKKRFLKEGEAPAGTPDYLRPYQTRGVAWIKKMLDCGVHPLLADEMGLGKTLQILSVIALDPKKTKTALIICPASVVPVWKNEILKFFPDMPVSVWGTLQKNVPVKSGVFLTSYGYFRNNRRRLCRRHYTYAVLDEAQFIKNPTTKIAHAVMEIKSKYRIALTGTPIENRNLDLWTIFRFLMPGLLGRRTDLEGAGEEDSEQLEKLRTQIAPFILRRSKEEVAKDLPEKVLNVLYCPLTERQRESYETIARHGVNEYGDKNISEIYHKKSLNFLTLLLRLRQAACDLHLLRGNELLPAEEASGKLAALSERVEEIVDNGGHIVIFSQFVKFLNHAEHYLRERFPSVPFFKITGETTDRAEPVKQFQECKGPAIFLISLRAGGTGLTLTSAEYVFLLDPWWNPAVEEQAIDRVHRIGQTRRVFVYRMIAAGTIEERIEQLKQSKREIFSSLIENNIDISKWSQFYPTLESLFALKED